MIRFTAHAQRRLAQRNIAQAWVELAIAAPDRTQRDADPTLTQAYKAIPQCGGRILKVVHRPDGPDTIIITAHFDRGAT